MCFKGAIGNGANVSFFFTSQMRMTLADCGWLQAEKHFFVWGQSHIFCFKYIWWLWIQSKLCRSLSWGRNETVLINMIMFLKGVFRVFHLLLSFDLLFVIYYSFKTKYRKNTYTKVDFSGGTSFCDDFRLRELYKCTHFIWDKCSSVNVDDWRSCLWRPILLLYIQLWNTKNYASTLKKLLKPA